MSSKTNMEQTIQTLKGDNQELMKENASLKLQIGGYKSSNARYKQQANKDAMYVKHLQKENNSLTKDMEVLQIEIGKTKNYAKEADELNEKKAEQIESLNATVEEKDRVIAVLQSQIAELNKRIANNEKNIQDITGERDVAIANYEYVCNLPWYQKMFFKGK